MLVLGLTGGIATGKTTVANILAELGAEVIDADQVARELVGPGMPGFAQIVRAFGKEILCADGSINRQQLAELVFADLAARQKLNQITHPLIIEEVKRRIKSLRESNCPPEVVVLEAAILIEVDALELVDKLLVVTAKKDTQIKRLKEKGLSQEEALARIEAQMPNPEKLKYADWVIGTDCGLGEVKRRVAEFYEGLIRSKSC